MSLREDAGFDGVLWLEAECEHGGSVGPHDDHAGNNGILLLPCFRPEHCQHPKHCSGGTRRRVTVNYDKAREASRIDEGTDWPLEVLMEPEAFISIVVDAALEIQE